MICGCAALFLLLARMVVSKSNKFSSSHMTAGVHAVGGLFNAICSRGRAFVTARSR